MTELSLILTLLDYVDPPDLLPDSTKNSARAFKLPTLRDTNIFHTNFFKLKRAAKESLSTMKFDWIVGNPPWKDLNPAKLNEQDMPVWEWMSSKENKKFYPCGDNDVAQAFAWRAGECLQERGAVALLMPAMTLFEDLSRHFRAQFFTRYRVSAVANFSNLARDLFAGRSLAPAAAFFFGSRRELTPEHDDEYVTVFSPITANQEITRPDVSGERHATWKLLISTNEIKQISLSEIGTGSGLPWKIAMWGSPRDRRLVERFATYLPRIKELERDSTLIVSEGVQLRSKSTSSEILEPCSILNEKPVLQIRRLASLRHVFAFTQSMCELNDRQFLRVRGGRRGLLVCRPPHVIVSEARTFAVFSDDFIVVPPRQVGISSGIADADFLKALSLFL
ncbi:MAG: Eco57I restriction-modification methylase domain-containing protein, partial [Schlesneria sp.]